MEARGETSWICPEAAGGRRWRGGGQTDRKRGEGGLTRAGRSFWRL